MADPSRRHAILAVFASRLAAIQVANGYQTDAGLAVYLGVAPELGESDPDAAIAILAGDDVVKYQGENLAIDFPVILAAIAKADLAEPWAAIELLLDDIKRAVELPDRTLGKLVPRQILRGSTRTLPREPGSTTVGVGVTYVAPYVERWGAP